MTQKHLDSLNKLLEQAQNKWDSLDSTYYSRTETWQDSEKGQNLLDKLNELEEYIGNIEMTIESLETYLNI